MTEIKKETRQNEEGVISFITFDYFKSYFKQDLTAEDTAEIENLIIRASETIIGENNTDHDLVEEWGTDGEGGISIKDKSRIKQLTAMLVNKFYEMGIDKAITSTSTSMGSQSVNYSFEDDNKLQDRFYRLYAQTNYYEPIKILGVTNFGFDFDDNEGDETFKTGELLSNTSIEHDPLYDDPGFPILLTKGRIIKILQDAGSIGLLTSNIGLDIEEKPEAELNAFLLELVDRLDQHDIEINGLQGILETLQDSIATNTSNIDSITTTLEENTIGELIAKGTAGTLTEGVWLPISFSTIDKNTFGNLSLSGDTFTITESINNLNVLLQGQTANTNISKTIQLRLWNITTNLQVGDTQQIVISSVGEAKYQVPANLSIGDYRIEIFATTGSGTITFDNYFISLLKFGGGTGAGAVKSSQLISDVETLPNTGFNQEITNLQTQLNTTTAIAEGNTSAIELLENKKQDKEEWVNITKMNDIKALTTKYKKMYIQINEDSVISLDFPDIIDNTDIRLYVPFSIRGDSAIITYDTCLFVPNLNTKSSVVQYKGYNPTSNETSNIARDILIAKGVLR